MVGSFAQHFSEVPAGTDIKYFNKFMRRGADSCHMKIKWINTMRMGED